MLLLLLTIFAFAVEEIIRGARKAKDKKSYLVKSFTAFTLVALLLCLYGPLVLVFPVKPGFAKFKEGNLSLYYPKGMPSKTREEILRSALSANYDNQSFFQNNAPLSIYVATSPLDMLRLGAQPKSGGGGSPLGIVVRDTKASTNVIAHEMSHRNLSLISNKPSSYFPRWFDEGLASYVGKMDYYQKREDLSSGIAQGRYIRNLTNWHGIAGMLRWSYATLLKHNIRQLYGQSYLMMQDLFDTYGQKSVRNFFTLTKNNSYKHSFEKSFNLSEAAFYSNFLAKISQ